MIRNPSPDPAMSDEKTVVADLRRLVDDFVDRRDWHQFHTPKNLSMSLAIEAAELMEHFQWLTPEQSRAMAQQPGPLAEVAEELADVVCYALAMANELGLDLRPPCATRWPRTSASIRPKSTAGGSGPTTRGRRCLSPCVGRVSPHLRRSVSGRARPRRKPRRARQRGGFRGPANCAVRRGNDSHRHENLTILRNVAGPRSRRFASRAKTPIENTGRIRKTVGLHTKLALPLVCILCVFGGLLGASIFSTAPETNPTFESVTITEDLVVASGCKEGAGCRMRPDGTLTATKGLLTNQIRGQVVSAQSSLASTNPLNASLDDQQILAQMVADPRSGGRLVALNLDAAMVPSQGPPPRGTSACIGFHPGSGRPEIFTQDLARGEAGKSFVLSVRPGAHAPRAPSGRSATWQRRGLRPRQAEEIPAETAAKVRGPSMR